jgi:hypothetical protein
MIQSLVIIHQIFQWEMMFKSSSIFSFSGKIKFLCSNLIIDIKMLQIKFGDHQSITSVKGDALRYFFFKLYMAQKGANQINMTKLDKRLLKNSTDKIK